VLAADNLKAAIDVAEAPLAVRGFGHVKQPSARALLERLRAVQLSISPVAGTAEP
jgi:hypothetical protein